MDRRVLLKLSPIFCYVLLHIIDVGGNFFTAIIAGSLSTFLFLLFRDWGLIIFEVYLLTEPKGKLKYIMGAAVIGVSIISTLWAIAVCNFIFNNFDGHWRLPLMLEIAMNAVYIVGAIVIMCIPEKKQ